MSISYKLSNKATQDLIDIMKYTLEEWGSTQVEVYTEQLEHRLQSTSTFPDIGRKHIVLPFKKSCKLDSIKTRSAI